MNLACVAKLSDRKCIKILTPKEMLQRLPIAFVQVQAGNLINTIKQIIYSLYQAKEITKKVYDNIKNSINLSKRIDAIFMNSGNSKRSDPYRLLLNLLDITNIKSKDKYIALSNLRIYYRWKNMKRSYESNKLKISAPLETMKLLGSTKSKITKDKNSENVPHSEITKVALIHFNIVNNDYLQDSRAWSAFVPNKSFGQLLDISPKF